MRHVLLLVAALASAALATPVPASAQSTPRIDTSGLATASAHDQFIVQFREGTPAQRDIAQMQSVLDRAAASTGVTLVHVRRMATGAEVIRASRKLDSAAATTLMQAVAADPAVEYIEVDSVHAPLWVPNDARYSEQWALKEASAYGIHAERAWDLADGKGMVVAVVDSGVLPHADLPTLLPGYDFVSDVLSAADGDGRDADPTDPGDARIEAECGEGMHAMSSTWHGTKVASVIGAVTHNAKGVAGVARAASIVPVRVTGKCGGTTSDIADAIIWAAGGPVPGVPENVHPAVVVNLSVGVEPACGPTMQRAVNMAGEIGTTLVAAAGNDGSDLGDLSPASCNNLIVVAASTEQGIPAWFSNRGVQVDLAAPGERILTTSNDGKTQAGSDSYAYSDGTSFAAPMVAGVVALMQSVAFGPTLLAPDEIEDLLKQTATPFSRTPPMYGVGILHATRAVEAAMRPTIASPIYEAILGADEL